MMMVSVTSFGLLSTMSSSLGATAFVVFGVLSVVTLKELNTQVTEPYMVSHASDAQLDSTSHTQVWVVG